MIKSNIFVALHTTNVEANAVLQCKQLYYMYIAINFKSFHNYPVFSTNMVTLLSTDFKDKWCLQWL